MKQSIFAVLLSAGFIAGAPSGLDASVTFEVAGTAAAVFLTDEGGSQAVFEPEVRLQWTVTDPAEIYWSHLYDTLGEFAVSSATITVPKLGLFNEPLTDTDLSISQFDDGTRREFSLHKTKETSPYSRVYAAMTSRPAVDFLENPNEPLPFKLDLSGVALTGNSFSGEWALHLADGSTLELLQPISDASISVTVAWPTCEIAADQGTYATGDTVTLTTFRLANPGADPLPVEVKTWFEIPGFDPIAQLRVGHDGSVVLPPDFDWDYGPLRLLDLVPGFPLGTYAYRCRLLDPVTGETLDLGEARFEVQ